jgi:serine/threonine protein kinase
MLSIPPHRNVVRTLGMCQEASNFSLVMEFLKGGSLDSYIEKKVYGEKGSQKWNPNILYRLVIGIARGMSHLAQQGVVHRDLAARNVLMNAQMEPKIADFGMSRMLGSADAVGQTASVGTQISFLLWPLSQPQLINAVLVGPIRWMPPESFQQKYSEKSDVWAYGVTLYVSSAFLPLHAFSHLSAFQRFEISTGCEPFAGMDILKVAVDVRDHGRTVLTDLPKDIDARIPGYLRAIMQSCFKHNPDERPTFAEIADRITIGMPSGYKESEDVADEEDEDDPAERAANTAVEMGNYEYFDDEEKKSSKTNITNKKTKTSKSKEPPAEELTEVVAPSAPKYEQMGQDAPPAYDEEVGKPNKTNKKPKKTSEPDGTPAQVKQGEYGSLPPSKPATEPSQDNGSPQKSPSSSRRNKEGTLSRRNQTTREPRSSHDKESSGKRHHTSKEHRGESSERKSKESSSKSPSRAPAATYDAFPQQE